MEKPEMWHEKKDIDEQGTERARQAEKMVKFLTFAKNIPAFKGKSVEDVFSSEENKREFIKNLTNDDFMYLLKGINALSRDKNLDSSEMDWAIMQVESGLLGSVETFSHPKDKLDLFNLLLKAMQDMNRNEASMEDISLLCGASTNAIHAFSDGNGRTSRFVYSMLNNNFNNDLKNGLKRMLTGEGREIINIDPSLVGYYLDDLIEKEVGIAREGKNKTVLQTVEYRDADVFKGKTSEQDFKELVTALKNEDKYLLYAIYDCFKNDINLNEYIPSELPCSIAADWLFEDLSSEEIKKVLERYWELKKIKVEILIDCIVHPGKEDYQINSVGRMMSIKDCLKEKIKNEREEKVLRKEEKEREKEEEKEIAADFLVLEKEGKGTVAYSPDVLNSLRRIENELKDVALSASQRADLYNRESDDEKAEKLKGILYKIATSVNKDVAISQENFDAYFNNKKQEILKNYSQYIIADAVLSFLDKSNVFCAKLSMTKNVNNTYGMNQEEIIDDLLSHSINYVTPQMASIQVKLKNINKGEEIIQPIMERAFFYRIGSKNGIGKNVIKFDFNIDLNELFNIADPQNPVEIFEIRSSEFDQEINKQEDSTVVLDSSFRMLSSGEKLYVKKSERWINNLGYYIDHAEKLNEVSM